MKSVLFTFKGKYTTHFFYKYYNIDSAYVEKVRIEALKGKICNFNELMKITKCTRAPVKIGCPTRGKGK